MAAFRFTARRTVRMLSRERPTLLILLVFSVLLLFNGAMIPSAAPLVSSGTHEAGRRRLQGVFPIAPDYVAMRPYAPASEPGLAYFIQISGSTMDHLPRLLRALHGARHVYAIHVDRKVPLQRVRALRAKLLAENKEYAKNVHFMPREMITYRGVSMLLNTIHAMQFLLDKHASWTFFINLSGSDYPLVSSDDQLKMLSARSARYNYFTLAPREKWARNTQYRVANFYFDEALSFGDAQDTKVREIFQRNPLVDSMNFEYTNSEAWMINSREFCEFTVKSAFARKMLLSFAFSVESSEHYFSTLAWNHPRFNQTIVPHALRHVVWNFNGKHSGQHPYYVDEQNEKGEFVLREAVLGAPQFFTRKFKHADSPLMDVIDKWRTDQDHLKKVDTHIKWVTLKAENNAKWLSETRPALEESDEEEII